MHPFDLVHMNQFISSHIIGGWPYSSFRNDNLANRSENMRSWDKAGLSLLAIKAADCFKSLWIYKTTVIAGPFVELHIHRDSLTCSNELLGCI